jgi:hypothetical protein
MGSVHIYLPSNFPEPAINTAATDCATYFYSFCDNCLTCTSTFYSQFNSTTKIFEKSSDQSCRYCKDKKYFRVRIPAI